MRPSGCTHPAIGRARVARRLERGANPAVARGDCALAAVSGSGERARRWACYGPPMRLYNYAGSANGYKAELLLALLGRPYERVEVAIFSGEGRTPEFLAKNPAGRIPVLELDDGTCLPESNA